MAHTVCLSENEQGSIFVECRMLKSGPFSMFNLMKECESGHGASRKLGEFHVDYSCRYRIIGQKIKNAAGK